MPIFVKIVFLLSFISNRLIFYACKWKLGPVLIDDNDYYNISLLGGLSRLISYKSGGN